MRILTVISGYQGPPIALASVLDENTGVLVIAKQLNYREDRPAPDMAVVSNLDLPECDFMYSDKRLRDSIRAYFARRGQGMVEIESILGRYLPDNKIEQDGVDESGRKFRIAPDIDNGQIAVLATVAFVEAQKHISSSMTLMDDLSEFYRVTSI